MRIQGRSARRWPWFGALALTLACPLGHAQSAHDIDVVALGRTLQREIGDSVKVSIESSDRVRLAADGALLVQTTRYLHLEFPTRRFPIDDRAGQYAYLGHVAPRVRRIAEPAAGVLGLRLSLEMAFDSIPPGNLTGMVQSHRWLPGEWPQDSTAVTPPSF